MSTRDQRPLLWMPILMYHRIVSELPQSDTYGNCVKAETFTRHLEWVAQQGYQPISLSSAIHQPLPKKPIVITFDDGYADNFHHAWPILKQFGYPATVFLVTDAIGGDNGFDSEFILERVPMLTVDQIKTLYAKGIEFGSHSRSHPATLTTLSDVQLRQELVSSREQIETLLDTPIQHFSYPHSQLDERVEAAVEEAGYKTACAGEGSRFTRYCLTRIAMLESSPHQLSTQIRVRQAKWHLRRWLPPRH